MKRKLSIIVPVYGAEAYLTNNMKTIIEQLTTDCELILVDDGSKDSSGKICDELGLLSSQVSVIHKINGGVSSARNAGIQAASGEYITFVDSDDYVEDNYIRVILEAIHSQDDLIFFGSYLLESDRDEKSLMKPWLSELTDSHSIEIAQKLIFGCKSNEPWDKVFKLKILKENNLCFPESINLGEDLIFSLAYLKYVHSVSVLDDPIYCHIFNKNGLGQQQVSIEAMKYHDAVFSKIMSSLNELEVSKDVMMLSYEMIIQILANYVGKLYKAGYSKEKIYLTISAYPWYENILSHNYSTLKSNLRKVLLLIKQYRAISLIFRK